jgi:hypothetical protein
MSPKQKKIAAKAPPPDKIDAKDFAVLKKEKAKGRGMGLQDESVQPGKVMKAKTGKQIVKEFSASLKGIDESFKSKVHPMKKQRLLDRSTVMTKAKYGKIMKAKRGEFLRSDPTKPISSVQPSTTLPKDFLGKRKALGGVRASLGMLKGPAKAGAILGAALTVPVGKMLKKIQDKRKAKNRDEAKVKKMAGGMAKKYSKGGDLRAEYIHSQTKKNRKVTGEGYFTERSATRREEYGAAKDRYPNKMDRRKQMLKNLSRVLNPTMGVVKGTIDALNAPTTRKYSVGGGASSKEVYTNARANVDAEGRKNMTMKDLKEARRETYSTKKMVGGMAKKYSNGMTDKTFTDPKTAMIAHSMKTEDKIYKRDREAAKMLEKKAPKGMYSSFMEEKKAIDKVKASKKILGRMGGGMMNKPMGYSSGSKLMDFIKSGSYTDKYGTKTNVDKAIKKINLSPKDKDLATMKPASDKKMMGGGMMQRPMGYKSGTMVKARGCKLGRTRPTKMY